MKTLTKKAIVLASAIAVAGTFAVCAASYDGDAVTATNPTTDNRSVTVSFSTDVAATDQITILAYYAPTGAETPDAKNIVYIDQVQKDALSSLTFSLRDDDATGAYKVLMGGTGVAKAGAGSFTLSAPAPTGSTISGTVGPVVYFGSDPELAEPNAEYQTVATLWDETFSTTINTMVVDSSLGETGSFSFNEVADGNYIVTLERAGKCLKAIFVPVSGADVNVGAKVLKGVDLNDDFDVNPIDIGMLVDIYLDGTACNYGDLGYNAHADENGDGTINPLDIGNAVDAYLSFNDPEAPYQEI